MGKRKIPVAKIENAQYRMVSFSKRRSGLFKKAKELSALTGARTAVLVISEAGRPYAEASPSIDSVVGQFLDFPDDDDAETASTPKTEIGDSSTAAVTSPDDDGFGGSLRGLLGAEVDGTEGIEELMALKEKLEEMRQWVSLALDFKSVDSFFPDF